MQGNVGKPKLTVSDGLYRLDHPDSDLFMPGSVWATDIRTLGDYIRHMQEVSEQSDQSDKPSESDKSDNPNFQHICPNNPLRTCNCGDKCADFDESSESDKPNNDGFADNLSYTHSTARTTERDESEVLGWPCVVVGG